MLFNSKNTEEDSVAVTVGQTKMLQVRAPHNMDYRPTRRP